MVGKETSGTDTSLKVFGKVFEIQFLSRFAQSLDLSWSDAAREAALAARREKHTAFDTKAEMESFGKKVPYTNLTKSYENGKVLLEMHVFPAKPHHLEIESIDVPKEQGKGHGTKVLKRLTGLADKHGTTLYLDSIPFAKGLTHDRLRQWYEKHGFKGVTGEVSLERMVREPETLPPAE